MSATEPGGPAVGFPLPGLRLPAIDGGKVRLRAIVGSDLEALYRLFADPETTRYMNIARLSSREAAAALLAKIDERFRDHTLYQWAVVAGDDRLRGTVTLADLDATHGHAEIGFALLPEDRGQGLMSAAVAALLRFAFERMRLRRIQADVDPDNEASIRLLQRQGFRREGQLRQRWLVDGDPRDAVMMGLLAREWADPAKKPAAR